MGRNCWDDREVDEFPRLPRYQVPRISIVGDVGGVAPTYGLKLS
jgi:hypothetical protein